MVHITWLPLTNNFFLISSYPAPPFIFPISRSIDWLINPCLRDTLVADLKCGVMICLPYLFYFGLICFECVNLSSFYSIRLRFSVILFFCLCLLFRHLLSSRAICCSFGVIRLPVIQPSTVLSLGCGFSAVSALSTLWLVFDAFLEW